MKHSLLFCSLLAVLSGCVSNQTSVDSTSPDEVNAPPITQSFPIARLAYALPSALRWQSSRNQQGNVIIMTPQGMSYENAKVRIIYQVAALPDSADMAMQRVIKPLSASCQQHVTKPLATSSKYRDVASTQVLCNALGDRDNGMIVNTVVFNDGKYSHILISELITPKTVTPGQFPPAKSPKDKLRQQGMHDMQRSLDTMMQSVQACNNEKQCF